MRGVVVWQNYKFLLDSRSQFVRLALPGARRNHPTALSKTDIREQFAEHFNWSQDKLSKFNEVFEKIGSNPTGLDQMVDDGLSVGLVIFNHDWIFHDFKSKTSWIMLSNNVNCGYLQLTTDTNILHSIDFMKCNNLLKKKIY